MVRQLKCGGCATPFAPNCNLGLQGYEPLVYGRLTMGLSVFGVPHTWLRVSFVFFFGLEPDRKGTNSKQRQTREKGRSLMFGVLSRVKELSGLCSKPEGCVQVVTLELGQVV